MLVRVFFSGESIILNYFVTSLLKAKEGNRAHLHESQMTEKQNVTDEVNQ